MTSEEERELVRLWQQGDAAARDLLVCHTRSRITGTIRKQIHHLGFDPTHDTDDVLQDALMAACHNVESGQFKPGEKACFSTYCLVIANRRAIDLSRRKRPATRLPTDIADGKQTDPAAAAARRELIERLVSALSCLDDPWKTVVCLYRGIRLEHGTLVDGKKLTPEDIGRQFKHGRGWASDKYSEALAILARKMGPSLDK